MPDNPENIDEWPADYIVELFVANDIGSIDCDSADALTAAFADLLARIVTRSVHLLVEEGFPAPLNEPDLLRAVLERLATPPP